MKIEEIEIIKVKPYENNAKMHDAVQIANVAESIRQFGWAQPIVIDRDNTIIIGHCRFEAAKKLGLKTVPVYKALDLNEEQVKKLRALDNKLNESEWDMDLLQADIGELDFSDFDIQWGWEEEAPAEPEVIEVDTPDEEEVEDIVQPGEIWQLGRHTLVCGDSTDDAVLDAALGEDEMANLVVTDPPYNVDYTGGTEEAMKIQNDNMATEQFQEFLTAAFQTMTDHLKPGGAFYIWHASRTQREFENALNEVGLQVREQIIWNKNALVLGRQDYQWKHEPCFYGWKDGAPHYFIDDRTQTTVIEDTAPELKKMKKEEMLKLLEDIYSEKVSTTVINEDKPPKNDLHPTMKPVKLLARLIKNSSRQLEVVLDPFGGSGSTLMACEQLNRICKTIELDTKYASVIVKRWEDFTGREAKKIGEIHGI